MSNPTDEHFRHVIAKVITAKETNGPDDSLESYKGDVYFVAGWLDADTPLEKAVAEVQDPLALFIIIWTYGLEYVLADKHATAGLKKCLLENNRAVRRALAIYAAEIKPKRKPGPRPKDGKYKSDIAVELRKQGLTLGQIAKALYGDPKKSNRVSASLAQVRKKKLPAGQ